MLLFIAVYCNSATFFICQEQNNKQNDELSGDLYNEIISDQCDELPGELTNDISCDQYDELPGDLSNKISCDEYEDLVGTEHPNISKLIDLSKPMNNLCEITDHRSKEAAGVSTGALFEQTQSPIKIANLNKTISSILSPFEHR